MGTGGAVQAGASAPALERNLTTVSLMAYGGATWDWHRVHYDAAYAAELGLPGPLVDGPMLAGLLAEQLLDWLGPRAFIRRMSFRFRSMAFPGETVRCEAEVTSVEHAPEGLVVEVSQRVLVGRRAAVEPASALVVIQR